LKGNEAVIMTSATAIQPKKKRKTNDLSHKHAFLKGVQKSILRFYFVPPPLSLCLQEQILPTDCDKKLRYFTTTSEIYFQEAKRF